MKAVMRSLVVCLLCGATGLACLPALPFGGRSFAASTLDGRGDAGSAFLPMDSLVVPGAEVLMGGQQVAELARSANPEAIERRRSSASAYEGLGAGAAERLTNETLAELVSGPASAGIALPAGAKVTRYLSDFTAAVALPRGGRGVVESVEPIAVGTSSGRAPVDLSLASVGGGFEPKRAPVDVRLAAHASGGASLTGLGASLVPADAQGQPLTGAPGRLDGAGMFYGDSEDPSAGIRDLDTFIKPTVLGFDEETILRSDRAPRTLYFKAGLPAGASLTSAKGGAVRVVIDGRTVARILASSAHDAEAVPVPISLRRVSSDLLALSVPRRAGQYAYPIVVDPAYDAEVTGSSQPTNWHFCTSASTKCLAEEGHFRSTGWGGTEGLTDEATGKYLSGERAEFLYKAHGESKIEEAEVKTEATNNENPGANIETTFHVVNENGTDDNSALLSVSKNYSLTKTSLKACEGCGGGHPENHNTVHYIQAATAAGEHFRNRLVTAIVTVKEETTPSASFDTTDQQLLGTTNVLYSGDSQEQRWLGPHQGALKFSMEDKGLGISSFNARDWSASESLDTKEPIKEKDCSGVFCPETASQELGYAGGTGLPNGVDSVELIAKDAAGAQAVKTVTLYVDSIKPSSLGLTGLPSSGIIAETPYHLLGHAVDGGAEYTSGIKSLILAVDGYELPGKVGVCKVGPCSALSEWTLNGEEIGAGKHKLELVATDFAGNVETKSYEITVRHANPVKVGPGSVDPLTGAFMLSASDVSIGGGYGTLGVSRSYDSRQLTAGANGPLGAQWSMSVSGEQGLESEPTGAVTLVATDGSRTTFESNGKGGFVSPKGDENLALSAEMEGSTVKAYLLKEPAQGSTLKFVHPTGSGSSNLWVIETAEGAQSKTTGEKLSYKWEVLEGIERPKEALAPAPAGVSCEPEPKNLTELKVGCRALSFSYATETKAGGESPSEWGEYKGRLKSVSFTAYDPSSKAMTTTAVAEYSYDKQGRLRAAWDPRVSPALKSTYGYDSEGHVVSVDPPGQEPWLLHYGAIASDPGTGRLLSASRPSASTALASGPVPSNTAAPTLSAIGPVIGTTLSVSSNGSWNNSPLAYSYQWEDCNSTGGACKAIPGALNQTYTPQASDAGYTLEAAVTAVNADGSAAISTSHSNPIVMPALKYTATFGSVGTGAGQVKSPSGVAVDSAGNVWVADTANNRIDEFNASGTFVEAMGQGVSNGEFKFQTCTSSCRAGTSESSLEPSFKAPKGITAHGEDIYVANTGANNVYVFTNTGHLVTSFGGGGGGKFGEVKEPMAVAIAPSGDIWVADRGNNRIDEYNEGGTAIGSFTGELQLKEPTGVAFLGENAFVVDAGNNRVDDFNLSGERVGSFGSTGSEQGQFTKPVGIAVEPVSHDLYVADSGNNRVQEFNPSGEFIGSVGSLGEGTSQFKGVEGVGVSASGLMYASDLGNNRVQKFSPSYSTSNPLPAPPSLGTTAVTTVDYQVPVSGAGAPYSLGATEVEAWAQTDDPVEATAIFPPDEPMGWPAQDYKRASVSYFDSDGRAVNTAAPSGSISTTEFNETNDVTRTLSGANRAQALKEGAKSVEVAKLLDTEYSYNAEGTELTKTLGPQHTIKLDSGYEKLARESVHDYYDEGAPGGETYRLLTKTIDAAKFGSGGEEADELEKTFSYSGQENLGWLLRKPTSVTVDPTDTKLVNTTFYDPATGKTIEARAPLGGTGSAPVGSYLYSSQITTGGTPETLKAPSGVVVDSSGNVWLADGSRVVEFNSAGKYVSQFGSEGTGEGQFKGAKDIAYYKGELWVTDSGNNRIERFTTAGGYVEKFGSSGTGNGQFKSPEGIAIDASGNLWVADTENNRVQELSGSGTYISQFGSSGTGATQFKDPEGLRIDSKGHIWVVDTGNQRVKAFSTSGESLVQFGSEGTGNGQFKNPIDIAVGPKEEVWVSDLLNARVQKFSLSGTYEGQFGTKGSENGQFSSPTGVATNSSGNVWVADLLAKSLQEITATGEYMRTAWSPVALSKPDGVALFNEKMWVADTGSNRIEGFTTTGEYLTGFGGTGTETKQFKEPHGIATDASGNVWVADTGNNRVQEISAAGKFIKSFGSEGTGNSQFKKPSAIAIHTYVYVVDSGNNRVEEFNSAGTYLRSFGSSGSGEGQFSSPDGIAIDTAKGRILVADKGNSRVEMFTLPTVESEAPKYVSQFTLSSERAAGIAVDSGSRVFLAEGFLTSHVTELGEGGELIHQFGGEGSGNGQLKSPEGVGLDSSRNAWVADTENNRVQEFSPVAAGYHAAQTVYYSSGPNQEYTTCGNHPEWAGLVCRTQPALQPATGKKLPIVTDTYNLWDEPETVTEEFGTTIRTKKSIYDAAGRLTGSEVTSSVDTALPKVTNEYSSETGSMIKQSATVGEKTQTITSVYNKLGQLTEYVDADGNKSTYTYEIDGQVEEMSDGKGSQVYSYDPTTKNLTKLMDSSAKMFTAGYDLEGRLTSETYPDGVTAKYVYNEVGEPTHVEYVKETHCAGTCPEVWFSESVIYSIHNEPITRSSTLANESYLYNTADMLWTVYETPAGKGCVIRSYGYDKDSNRTVLTTYQPNSKNECSTISGSTEEKHTYDEADRLSDTGTTYEAFGNVLTLPAADAEGHEISSTYYVSNQTRTTAQNGKTVTYELDPDARARETITEEGATKTIAINHYSDSGAAISWTNEGGEKYTRDIPGIDGALTAVQKNGEEPVLQLHDLVGNVVLTAALAEAETKPLTTYNSSEFGVPVNGTPPAKYSWLGASGYTSEFASGGGSSSGVDYVPQLGKLLQTQAIVPPGVLPDNTYITPYVSVVSEGDWNSGAAFAAEAPMREAARQKKAEEEAIIAELDGADPWKVYNYGYWEAYKLAKELREGSLVGRIDDLFASITIKVSDFVIGLIVGHFGSSTIEDWMDRFAERLEECGGMQTHIDRGSCRASVPVIPILNLVVNVPNFWGPEVKWWVCAKWNASCAGMDNLGPAEHGEATCLDGGGCYAAWEPRRRDWRLRAIRA